MNASGAYTVSLADASDIESLAVLEDEFIDDHSYYASCVGEDLCRVLGVNPIRAQRTATIHHIVTGLAQRPGVAWFTLKCSRLPAGVWRGVEPEVVGYLFTKVHWGPAGDVACAPSKSYAGKWQCLIEVSHLKVSQWHQRCGVATLLSAGALKHAEDLAWWQALPGSACAWEVKLSVLASNYPARALYKKLGFKVVRRRSTDKRRWVHMKRAGSEETPVVAALSWLTFVPGSVMTSGNTGVASNVVAQAANVEPPMTRSAARLKRAAAPDVVEQVVKKEAPQKRRKMLDIGL